MKKIFYLLAWLWAANTFAAPATAVQGSGYEARAEVQAFIVDMEARHGFDATALTALFAHDHQQQSVLRAITPAPAGKRSWQSYRGNFVSPTRVTRGVQFWHEHRATLEHAQATFGVPAEIIVAIIGIETQYGRTMGSYRVLDALTTLAFDYPRRADYFRSELEELLLYARESGRSPLLFVGSFAGAIGIPQFMPGSIRRFAVDFDRDGQRDLRDSSADAIGSVASFLQQHGWVAGEPIAVPASVEGESFRALIDGGVQPNHLVATLRAAGVRFDERIAPKTSAVLIELDSTDAAPEYLIGLQNFYVITRYNRSSFYASAVWSLAQEIKAAVAL